jgi:hypothetical protein
MIDTMLRKLCAGDTTFSISGENVIAEARRGTFRGKNYA